MIVLALHNPSTLPSFQQQILDLVSVSFHTRKHIIYSWRQLRYLYLYSKDTHPKYHLSVVQQLLSALPSVPQHSPSQAPDILKCSIFSTRVHKRSSMREHIHNSSPQLPAHDTITDPPLATNTTSLQPGQGTEETATELPKSLDTPLPRPRKPA